MATHVEAEVVVTTTTDPPSSETEEKPPTGEKKEGLFQRFKKKNGDGEKSRKPPGILHCTMNGLRDGKGKKPMWCPRVV